MEESVVEELLKQYETYKTQFEEWTTKNKGNVSQEAYDKYVDDFRSWEKVVLGQIKSATKKHHHHKSKKHDKKRSKNEKTRDEVEVQETKPSTGEGATLTTPTVDPLAMMMTMAMMMMPMMAQQQQQQQQQAVQAAPLQLIPAGVGTNTFLGMPPPTLPPSAALPPTAAPPPATPSHFLSPGTVTQFTAPPPKTTARASAAPPLPDLSRPPPLPLGGAAVAVRPFGSSATSVTPTIGLPLPSSSSLVLTMAAPPPTSSFVDDERMRREDALTARAERAVKRDFDDYWYNKFQMNQQAERVSAHGPPPPQLGVVGPSGTAAGPTSGLPSLVAGLQFTPPPGRFTSSNTSLGSSRHGAPPPQALDFGGPLMGQNGGRRLSDERRENNRSVSPRRRSPDRFNGRSRFGNKDFSMRRRDRHY